MASNISDTLKRIAPFLPSALLLGGLAVFVASCRFIVPQQGWSKKWGPMVPHKTFPGDCSLCHVPENWSTLKKDFAYDHGKETGYPLEGAHASAACLRCHNDRGPVEAYLARGCAGCHVDPHAGSLGLDCGQCHSQQNWRPQGLVAEHANTLFPLAGIHAVTACEECHPRAPTGFFMGAPTQCEQCHQQDLASVQSPDHLANGWVNSCERCHSQSGWGQSTFNHNFFPLTGEHAGVECLACHVGGNYSSLSPDCISCHNDDYLNAPNHAGNGWTDCQRCHTINGWDTANFNHGFFPLNGGHTGLDCTQCHVSGNYQTLTPDCISCHNDDYQTAPGHVSSGFSQDCTQCHSTATWQGATFNHAFPLSGQHDLSCTACHPGGNTSTFTCLNSCHSKSTTDSHHNEVRDYTYDSAACYRCHPNGKD